jgi:hypothetical protein
MTVQICTCVWMSMHQDERYVRCGSNFIVRLSHSGLRANHIVRQTLGYCELQTAKRLCPYCQSCFPKKL